MDDLRSKRFQLAAQIQTLGKEIRFMQKRSWSVPPRALHVVWLLYALGNQPRSAVLVHLRSFAESARHEDDDLIALAEQSFLSADINFVFKLCEGSDERALRAAKVLLAEQCLALWCKEMNVLHKICPSTAELVVRAKVYRSLLSTCECPARGVQGPSRRFAFKYYAVE